MISSLKVSRLAALCGAMSLVHACGDKVDVKEAPSNETLSVVYEQSGLKKVPDGQSITINRIRVLKNVTLSPGSGNGDDDNVDEYEKYADNYTLQLWVTMPDDSTPVFWQMENLQRDSDGNLYLVSNMPGKINFHDLSTDFLTGTVAANTVGGGGAMAFPSETVPSYTVTAENAFISKDFKPWFIRSETVSDAATAATPATQKYELIDLSEIASATPWKNARKMTVASASTTMTHTWYEKQDGTIVGTMGCMAKPVNAAGATLAKSFAFGDVNLGETILNKDGQPENATETTTTDGRADSNQLWIKWQGSWAVTGFNVDKKTVNIVQIKKAPYYLGRELPTVDLNSTAVAASKAEAFIKSCNVLAKSDNTASAAASKFAFFYPASVASIATAPTALSYDKTYEDNTDGQNNAAKSIFSAGAWNGTAHTSEVSYTPSNTLYEEMSPITTVQF